MDKIINEMMIFLKEEKKLNVDWFQITSNSTHIKSKKIIEGLIEENKIILEDDNVIEIIYNKKLDEYQTKINNQLFDIVSFKEIDKDCYEIDVKNILNNYPYPPQHKPPSDLVHGLKNLTWWWVYTVSYKLYGINE